MKHPHNYIESIAHQIRAKVPDSDLPGENTTSLFNIYAVLLLAKGSEVSAEDVHNAWCAWKSTRYPSHDALIPFDDLDNETAMQDQPFVDAIHSVFSDVKQGIS